MREWLRRNKMAAFALSVVAFALLAFPLYLAFGVPWEQALFNALFHAVVWAFLALFWLRASSRRKKELQELGLMAYIRFQGSPPGSLADMWAGGIIRCRRRQITFQEIMDGTDAPLGKPKTLDVIGPEGPERRASGRWSSLPRGWSVLTLTLSRGTVDIAAEPAALAQMKQEVFESDPEG